jgi:hypothetical protein
VTGLFVNHCTWYSPGLGGRLPRITVLVSTEQSILMLSTTATAAQDASSWSPHHQLTSPHLTTSGSDDEAVVGRIILLQSPILRLAVLEYAGALLLFRRTMHVFSRSASSPDDSSFSDPTASLHPYTVRSYYTCGSQRLRRHVGRNSAHLSPVAQPRRVILCAPYLVCMDPT